MVREDSVVVNNYKNNQKLKHKPLIFNILFKIRNKNSFRVIV